MLAKTKAYSPSIIDPKCLPSKERRYIFKVVSRFIGTISLNTYMSK